MKKHVARTFWEYEKIKLAKYAGTPIHILAALDTGGDSVTIVTAYRPEPGKWEKISRRGGNHEAP